MIILLIVSAFSFRYLLSEELEVTFHHLYSSKITNGTTVRVIVLSDLHNYEYGEDNQELVEQIRKLKPDIIAMAGDMVNQDDPDTSVAESLCRQLKEISPVYFGLGNHEGTMMYANGIDLYQRFQDAGATVLINQAVEVNVKNNVFLIGSVAVDEDGYEDYAEAFVEEYEKSDAFKLMISHIPGLYYDKMADSEIDLGLCGHYHGGQIQLPFLGGVYSVKYGLFPKYCSGMFEIENGHIFV